MKQFRLPDPGEGLVEAEIVTWRVAPGDQVKINDIVVEVETSKSLVELPIPFAGTVAELLVAEGDTVDVGSPIISIDDGTSSASAPQGGGTAGVEEPVPTQPGTEPGEDADAVSENGAGSGRVAVLVGYGPRTTEAKRRPRKKGTGSPGEPPSTGVADSFAVDHPVAHRADERHPLPPNEAQSVGAPLPGPGQPPAEPVITGGPVLAKPPVRKLAKDLGVDLASLIGSGDGGIITREDVLTASKAPAEDTRAEPAGDPHAGHVDELSTAPGEAPTRQATRIPIKGVRKVTAAAMVSSAFTAPHVSVWLTCDVSATMELVATLRQRREFAELKVSPLVVIAKAVCLALSTTRELNSSWDEPAQEIVLHGGVNLGIAAATPRGLVVPNVKDADQLGLVGLATKINELVGIARAGRIQPADTSGGTFSITNIGPLGVDAGTPILNPGEAGILAVGTIDRRPWVVGTGEAERIEPRWVTTLALSFDHRLADGEQGSRFLVDVANILRNPGMALLY